MSHSSHAQSVSLLGTLLVLLGVAAAGCEQVYRASPRPATRASVDPARDAVAPGESLVEPWTFGDFEGELVTTSTHRLHLTLPEGRLREEVPGFMETAVEHYRSMLFAGEEEEEEEGVILPSTPERMDVFLFGDRNEWEGWTRWRLGRDAGLYLKIERGGYTIDGESVLFDIGRYDTLCLLAHEGWHQYTQSIFKHPLPAWLEEGLATYAEGHRFRRSDPQPVFMPWRNLERFGQLRQARSRGRLLPIEQIMDNQPQAFVAQGERSLLTYYAQVWILMHYLVEGRDGKYRDGLVRLVRDAAEGHIASSLIKAQRKAGRRGYGERESLSHEFISAYFDKDVEDFLAGYDEFVEEAIASGGGMYVWRGRSPVRRD